MSGLDVFPKKSGGAALWAGIELSVVLKKMNEDKLMGNKIKNGLDVGVVFRGYLKEHLLTLSTNQWMEDTDTRNRA